MFDALSGLLKTAKKYKVVEYSGEQLWQGRDDQTKITLVSEQFTGIKIRRRSTVDLSAVSVRTCDVLTLLINRFRCATSNSQQMKCLFTPPPTPHTHPGRPQVHQRV